MKAIQIAEHGSSKVLRLLTDLPKPTPGPGKFTLTIIMCH